MAKKSIVRRIDRHLARRLREARQETGMSTRKVAGELPKRLAVSHSTLASYEKGVTKPSVGVLGALADLYHRPLNWFLNSRESLTCFRFRNLKPRSPIGERRQFEALAGKWVEAYIKLERHLRPPRRPKNTPIAAQHETTPEQLSAAVRNKLGLDDNQPIVSIVCALESFSALTMELQAPFSVDSASARRGNDFVVVFNPMVSNERLRMIAAHELAHVLYDECKQHLGWTDDVVEKLAYPFSSSLLLPDSQLALAFEGKSFLRLLEFKERFGISLSAMIYRAEKSRIINTSASRFLWSEMIKRGWKNEEPGYVWRDRAIGFEMMLEFAIQTKTLTWKEAETITGIHEEELKQRVAEAPDVHKQREEHKKELYPTTLRFPFTSEVSDSVE